MKRYELHDRYQEHQDVYDARRCPTLNSVFLITMLLLILAAILKH